MGSDKIKNNNSFVRNSKKSNEAKIITKILAKIKHIIIGPKDLAPVERLSLLEHKINFVLHHLGNQKSLESKNNKSKTTMRCSFSRSEICYKSFTWSDCFYRNSWSGTSLLKGITLKRFASLKI